MIYFTLPPFPVRMFDSYGSGIFGAPRSRKSSTRPHLGTDFVIEPGQAIPACIEGRAARRCTVYPDTQDWRGLVLKADWGGELKIFYLLAYPDIIEYRSGRGIDVTPDMLVGEAQDIRKRYPKNKQHETACTPHVHMQMTVSREWPLPRHWALRKDYIHYDGRCYVNVESLAMLNG